MTTDQDLLLKILTLLTEKTVQGRIPWSESPREGRYLAVVNDQIYSLTEGSDDDGPPSVIVTATDPFGQRMWAAASDWEGPSEIREPIEIERAVASLCDAVKQSVVVSRVDKMRHSLEALTAA